MIVLDTNVVSEALRPLPDPSVMRRLDGQTDSLCVTAITVGELWTGVRLLPPGARREALSRAVRDVLMRWATVLPYNAEAADVYGTLRELARDKGRGLSVEDGMIAAVCASRGATLATRNVADFEFLPVPIVDSWAT